MPIILLLIANPFILEGKGWSGDGLSNQNFLLTPRERHALAGRPSASNLACHSCTSSLPLPIPEQINIVPYSRADKHVHCGPRLPTGHVIARFTCFSVSRGIKRIYILNKRLTLQTRLSNSGKMRESSSTLITGPSLGEGLQYISNFFTVHFR